MLTRARVVIPCAWALSWALLHACSSPPPVALPPPGPTELVYSIEVPGKTSVEMDRDVAARVEQSLTAVPGVTQVELISRAGRLHVRCVLAPGAAKESMRGPLVTRLTDILAPMGAAAIPVRVEAPGAMHIAYTVGIAGVDPRALAAWNDATFPSVQSVPGLQEAETCGALRSEVHVALDPAKLAAREVGLESVVLPLQGTFASIAALSTTDLGGTTPLPVSELATVTETVALPRCRALRDGVPVLLASGTIDSSADPNKVRADVDARLRGVPPPAGLRIEPLAPTGPVATLSFLLAPGASWEESARMAGVATQALRRLPGVAHVIARIGASDVAPVGARETDLEVELALLPTDAAGRVALERTLVTTLKTLPGLQVRVEDGVLPQRSVRVVGEDLDALGRVAEPLVTTLRGLPGVEDAGILDSGREQVATVVIDRGRAADLGIADDQVARAVKAATEGIVSGSIVAGFRRMPIRVILGRVPVAANAIPADLAIPLRGGSVPLASFATVRLDEVPETVGRQGGHKMVRLWVRLANETVWQGVRAAAEAALHPPAGVAIVWE